MSVCAKPTLAYWKKVWEKNKFPKIQIGEDNEFVWRATHQIMAHQYRKPKLEEGDLPPVLDVETNTPHFEQGIFKSKIDQWIQAVQKYYNCQPIIYTGAWFWDSNVGDESYKTYPLWVAHYQTRNPHVPHSWNDWNIWQYGIRRSVAGIHGQVDADYFKGTLEQLKALTLTEVS